jgi:hypothetical protein
MGTGLHTQYGYYHARFGHDRQTASGEVADVREPAPLGVRFGHLPRRNTRKLNFGRALADGSEFQ